MYKIAFICLFQAILDGDEEVNRWLDFKSIPLEKVIDGNVFKKSSIDHKIYLLSFSLYIAHHINVCAMFVPNVWSAKIRQLSMYAKIPVQHCTYTIVLSSIAVMFKNRIQSL